MASAAFVVDLVLIGVAVATMNTEQWQTVLNHLSLQKEVSSYELLVVPTNSSSASLPSGARFQVWKVSAS
jgi:hypothetical protein